VIVDNAERGRYEIHADGALAGFVQYRRGPGQIAFLHTEIGEAFEGQGLGSELVAAALNAARDAGEAVLPFCPFVRGYIKRHSEYASLVPAAARAQFGL
jgi:predicted GNAT family acetyltransferase